MWNRDFVGLCSPPFRMHVLCRRFKCENMENECWANSGPNCFCFRPFSSCILFDEDFQVSNDLVHTVPLNEFVDAFSIWRVHNLHFSHFYWHIAGITGHVRIDDNGDRDADYSILDLDPITGRFEVVAHYYGLHRWVVFGEVESDEVELTLASSNRSEYSPVTSKKIHWPGGRHGPPPDVPRCGFLGNAPECHRSGYGKYEFWIYRLFLIEKN